MYSNTNNADRLKAEHMSIVYLESNRLCCEFVLCFIISVVVC